MYCENLENLILKRHNFNNADELLILGGFIGFAPLEKISKEGIPTKLIYGCMKNSDLNKNEHKKYVDLTKVQIILKSSTKKNTITQKFIVG